MADQRFFRHPIFVAAAILAALVVGTCLFIRHLAGQKWRTMQFRMEMLLRESKNIPSKRPVLAGTPIQGNAFDGYDRAVEHVHSLPDPDREAIERFWYAEQPPDVGEIQNLVHRYSGWIDQLKKAALYDESLWPIDWERGITKNEPDIRDLVWLARLSLIQAKFLSQDGHAGEAISGALAVCQFGMDMARNGTWSLWVAGLVVCRLSLQILQELVVSNPPSQEAGLQIARAMEILERSLPVDAKVRALRNEMVVSSHSFFKEEMLSDPSWRASWPHCFSKRWMTADTYRLLDKWISRVDQAMRLGWPEEKRVLPEIEAEMSKEEEGNVILRILSTPLRAGDHRELHAQARLIRTAAVYRAEGRILDLEDPFGDRLRWKESEGRLRIWSIGSDGKDDGGETENGADLVIQGITPLPR